MKYIKKNKEPNSLTTYRKQKEAYFDGYPEKDELRTALLKEQKYLCCYCMERISIDRMKIEHFIPRSDDNEGSELQLVYSNLLAACLGNEGQAKHLQHCDTRKANEKIIINPTLLSCESIIKFKSTGEIYSDDLEINKNLGEKEDLKKGDLGGKLNLNYVVLIKNRKKTLDSALKKFIEKHPKGTWSKAVLQREIDKWENSNLEEYEPYCQIVIFHLKTKLNRVG
jgi:uncharacterized protein (TIGR02646 family)